MNKILLDDLYRYEGERSRDLLVRLRYIFFTPGFAFTYFFRRASLAGNPLSRTFWSVFHRITMWITGIQIPIGTRIGRGFRILHFGTIVVNPGARIGENFNLAQGTLIGSAQGKRAGEPVIGDNVCMLANSIVVGGVRIGNDVLIAPGAFVNFDVPDNR